MHIQTCTIVEIMEQENKNNQNDLNRCAESGGQMGSIFVRQKHQQLKSAHGLK